MRPHVLITGGAGFVGSNLARRMVVETDARVVVLDKLTYAGHRETLADLDAHPRLRFVRGDIADARLVEHVFAEERFSSVLNLAAESHVDRSIDAPAIFVQTNVLGTQVLLDAARRHEVSRVVQVSTDEVYGALGTTGRFSEQTPLDPSSPYAASKAGADLLALAWRRTYQLPVIVTRCSNNYGPWQYPEKLIPVMIAHALDRTPLPVYGDGSNIRDWIHVDDHCAALLRALAVGKPGRIYNIGANNERSNLEIVEAILDILDRPRSLIAFVPDRPGHDWRYAVDARRATEELRWQPRVDFERGLEQTVRWYVDHQAWWRPLISSANNL